MRVCVCVRACVCARACACEACASDVRLSISSPLRLFSFPLAPSSTLSPSLFSLFRSPYLSHHLVVWRVRACFGLLRVFWIAAPVCMRMPAFPASLCVARQLSVHLAGHVCAWHWRGAASALT